MAAWKGKTRGGLTGYKIFIALLKYAGLPFAYLLLRFVAFYYLFFAPESFRNTYYFYHRRLGFGLLKSVIAIYRNYYVFGQVILDKTASLGGFDAKFTFAFDGEEYLRQMVKEGKGGLLISAHLGNFEMAGHMLERLNTRVNVLMLDAEHRKIKEYLSALTHKSFHVIPIGEDNAHIYELSRVLKDHEIVCLHGDRFMPGSKTLTAVFLGEKVLLPAGPFYLAMKYGVPVSFVFAMKESNRHYHFYASPPRYYAQQGSVAKRDEMLHTLMADFLAVMEEKVKRYPYQWFNYYNFWDSSTNTKK